jgi:hypothetical protein
MTTLFGVQARQATKAGGIESLETIPELLKCLQIQAQCLDAVCRIQYFLGEGGGSGTL